ncbi:hypothetical protein ACA910_018685 [Epithemia clementina (nom. ined.)]
MNRSPFPPPQGGSDIAGLFSVSRNDDAYLGGAATAAAVAITNTPTTTAMDNECHPDLAQLPELRRRVRSHVHNVILCLSAEETRAYNAAMAYDAELVQTETDPIQFVRYCEYNLLAGARRLCAYWAERLALFGPERAFLPLTLTGTGAMTPQDLLSLRAGYPALLPNNSKTGQPCLLFDRRCRVPNVSRESILRCLFYVYKVLAESDISQVDGVMVMVVAATPRTKLTDMDWEFAHRGMLLSARVFPVKNQLHLLSVPQLKTPVFAAKLVEGIVQALQQAFAGSSNRHSVFTTNLHVQTPTDSATKICQELCALGLSPASIPLFYEGGEWTLVNFLDWCQVRMESEQGIFQSRLLSAQENYDLSGGSAVVDVQWNRTPRNAMANAATTAEQSAKHIQQQGRSKTQSVDLGNGQQQRLTEDVIRSRRKRERKRWEFQQLQQDSSRLVRENELLKQEQTRLTRLWTEAEQCVAQLLSVQSNNNHN